MALANGTIFEIRSTATTGNVNGAGFNPANANFPTNYTVDASTGDTDSPVLSSATYSFVAGDVGALVYIKAGTNWYANTWLPIASVSGGKATLSAAIGAGRVQSTTDPLLFTATTVAGVASVGTPTGGTCGIDYSQQDAAIAGATDYACTVGSSTLTSASAGFRRSMIGNLIRMTTIGSGGCVRDWYEITQYTSTTTVTTDRSSAPSLSYTAATGNVGGACNLNATEDLFFEALPAGAILWVKAGTYTISAAISVTASNGTTLLPNAVIGYTTARGDDCNGTSRPLLEFGANSCLLPAEQHLINLRFTTTAANGIQVSTSNWVHNCSAINTSSTAGRLAWYLSSAASVRFTDCEGVSQNGTAFSSTTSYLRLVNCYIHDSNIGCSTSTGQPMMLNCVFDCNKTAHIDSAVIGAGICAILIGNTFYGTASQFGIGVRLTGASSTGHYFARNIFYGLTTGISIATAQAVDRCEGNTFYNCGTDVSGIVKDAGSLAIDPGITGVAQVTGSTATTSGSVLTQSGGDFSTVTVNVDYLQVISGTGVTVGCYLITAKTATTLTTNNALGTSSAGDVVYSVTTGHNFGIGTALKGLGATWTNQGWGFISYTDVGAVQRQEVAASGGGAMIVRIP